VGVAFAGDLITMFLFWEFMALFSTVVVWCGGTEGARRAGVRYAIMHLVGGVLLKIGIEGVMIHTGSVDIGRWTSTPSTPGSCSRACSSTPPRRP